MGSSKNKITLVVSLSAIAVLLVSGGGVAAYEGFEMKQRCETFTNQYVPLQEKALKLQKQIQQLDQMAERASVQRGTLTKTIAKDFPAPKTCTFFSSLPGQIADFEEEYRMIAQQVQDYEKAINAGLKKKLTLRLASVSELPGGADVGSLTQQIESANLIKDFQQVNTQVNTFMVQVINSTKVQAHTQLNEAKAYKEAYSEEAFKLLSEQIEKINNNASYKESLSQIEAFLVHARNAKQQDSQANERVEEDNNGRGTPISAN